MKRVTFIVLASLLSLFSIESFAQKNGISSYLKGDVVVVGFQNEQTPQFIEYYKKSVPKGFQQSTPPRFMIVGKNHNFILGIGGFVQFRTGYDFNRVVQNTDFVTYDVPMSDTPQNGQRFLMDASTSRLFFNFLATENSKLDGFQASIDMDFRGVNNAFRLRSAYVQYKGILLGQTISTFTDLTAGPNTIDFEGPSAYTYERNLMVRYTRSFGKGWSAAIAAEMPSLSATYDKYNESIPQRVPDFPVWLQYSWGKDHESHIRASAIFRDLTYYNMVDEKNNDHFGWGVQLSGHMYIMPKLQFYYQVLYGEGIGQYIQDLQGNGLDLVPDNRVHGRLERMKALGWFAALSYNCTPNLMTNIVYSAVNTYDSPDTYDPDRYKKGQYIAANVLWNIFPSCQVGIEYLHGIRKDFDGKTGHANRVQAMVQYNF